MKANHLEERELIAMARDIPFDDRINYHASIADLRPVLMADFLHSVGSELYQSVMTRPVEDVATDMHLVRGPVEYRKPINVGLLFFNEKPDEYFSYARIEVVDKPDPTGIGMTEKVFRGPLDKQLRDALSYIQNYIIKEYVTKVPEHAEAIRVYNWPYQAIDEALCNAVYHKSYQIHEPITVTITPEKLEILSLPGPDRSISDDDLENRVLISRRYRNRRIGDYLKELKMVEGRNTGIPLILNAMKQNGSDLPVFKTDEDRSYFQVILPIHPVFLKGRDDSFSKNEKTTRKNRDDIKKLIEVTLREHGELSMNELASELGYARLTNTIRAVVKSMIENGDAEYLYPNTPTSRKQKIRLVTK